jgi:hypothetical protein
MFSTISCFLQCWNIRSWTWSHVNCSIPCIVSSSSVEQAWEVWQTAQGAQEIWWGGSWSVPSISPNPCIHALNSSTGSKLDSSEVYKHFSPPKIALEDDIVRYIFHCKRYVCCPRCERWISTIGCLDIPPQLSPGLNMTRAQVISYGTLTVVSPQTQPNHRWWPLENTRGMQNPQGKVEGYMRVGVRVQELLPLTYPYPWGGYAGVGKGMNLLSGPMFLSKNLPYSETSTKKLMILRTKTQHNWMSLQNQH